MKHIFILIFLLSSQFCFSQKEIKQIEVYAVSYETIFEYHPNLQEVINERGQYVRVIDPYSIKSSMLESYIEMLEEIDTINENRSIKEKDFITRAMLVLNYSDDLKRTFYITGRGIIEDDKYFKNNDKFIEAVYSFLPCDFYYRTID